jgi:hypothetical protein
MHLGWVLPHYDSAKKPQRSSQAAANDKSSLGRATAWSGLATGSDRGDRGLDRCAHAPQKPRLNDRGAANGHSNLRHREGE